MVKKFKSKNILIAAKKFDRQLNKKFDRINKELKELRVKIKKLESKMRE